MTPREPFPMPPAAQPPSSKRDLIGLTLAAALLFFVALGARDLWNPNEPIYGRAVAEMAERGDWLIPTVNDRVFAEKPILYYWSALVSAELLSGVDELSLRVPSALAGVGSVLLVYLLVLPYAGRRRALLTAALFMTSYQVFWAARSVQMDILVLASTLGVLVPWSRFVDFGARPVRAFALAGLAAGLGFAAKGPVALVVPGVVMVGYAALSRRLDAFPIRPFLIGAGVAVAVSAPWYLLLWIHGDTAFLYEVLFRQNFTRFVEAWDHAQPWWYYLQYVWVDYLPWSLLLPAAFFLRPTGDEEKRLHRLSWVWIVGVIAFFSLSESKRAPYILPIAPAIAVLAGAVVDRWIWAPRLERGARVAAVVAWSFLALVLLAAGAVALFPLTEIEIPTGLTGVVTMLGVVLLTSGLALAGGLLLVRRRPALAPGSVLAGFTALYLAASIWALPAADSVKSARSFSTEMNRQIEATHGSLASFQFWAWRAEYSYYADRSIHDLENRAELESYWRSSDAPHVLVLDKYEEELKAILPEARLVVEGRVGSGRAALYAKPIAPEEPETATAAEPGSAAASEPAADAGL